MEMNPDQMQEAAEPGFTVCIRVEGGKYSVGVEQEGQEAEEYAGFQEYSTVKEALTAALDLIKGGGPEEAEEADSFNQSYTNRMPQNG